MKTEKQVFEKFEYMFKEFETIVASLSEDREKWTQDDVIKTTSSLSLLFGLGWVMDCEEVMAPIFTQLKVADLVSKFGDKK